MKTRLLSALAVLLLAASPALAAFSCSVSSNGFSTVYDPTVASTTTAQTSVAIDCTRSGSDPLSLTYSLAADNGVNRKGNANYARLTTGTALIAYDLYKNSACSSQWRPTLPFTGTFTFPAGALSNTLNITYWGCVTASQTGLPAGVYNDLLTMTLTYNTSQTAPLATFNANIATPPICNVTTSPGTLNFGTYTAFQAAAQTASAAYGVTCTAYMAYTMAVSPTSGTIAGLGYTLAPSVASSTGTGSAQSFTVDGTMAAGQSGTCGLGTCTGTNPHTLTISY